MSELSPIRGVVLRPGDEAFERETAGYNRLVTHRPAYVVVAADAGDVVAAVRFATPRGMSVAVQATGHGPPVAAAEGGVLISTRLLDAVHVDSVARTARFEAGVRSGAIVQAAAEHGLAPLNGSSPEVGAVSYTLSGGVPLMGRRFGYAADHVRAIEVVTADGALRHVSAERDPELFWALRGGGGNFGVVVAMEIDLVPVARLYGGGLYFSADATADVLHAYRAWAAQAPEAMGSSVLLGRVPDLPQVPDALRGRYVSHVRIVYAGSAAEGEQLVRPLRSVARPVIDTVRDMPYREVGTIHHEPTQPVAFYARTSALHRLEDGSIERLLRAAGPDANAPYFVELRHLGGALSRPPRVPNAAGRRDAAFSVYSGSVVVGDALEPMRAAHEALHRSLAPWSTGGACLNFLSGPDATPERVRSAYAPSDHARLAELKARFDPRNTFRVNHNIAPAR